MNHLSNGNNSLQVSTHPWWVQTMGQLVLLLAEAWGHLQISWSTSVICTNHKQRLPEQHLWHTCNAF